MPLPERGPRQNPDIAPWTHPDGWQVKRIEVLAVFRHEDYSGELGAMRAAYAFAEAAQKAEAGKAGVR